MELLTKDWLYNASLVGFIQFLKEADIAHEVTGNTLVFDEQALIEKQGSLPERYISVLLNKYKEQLSWSFYKGLLHSACESNLSQLGAEKDEKAVKKVYDDLKRVKVFLNRRKSYENLLKLNGLHEELSALLKAIPSFTWKAKDIEGNRMKIIDQQIEAQKLIRFIEEHKLGDLFYLADLTYLAINLFWNEQAFTNLTKKNKDVRVAFQTSFVEPVVSFLESNSAKKRGKKVQCFICNQEALKSDCKSLGWLREVGVNGKRKSSHFWNHEIDDFTCPVCSFIFQFLPIGFNIAKQEALFINDNGNIQRLVQQNTIFYDSNVSLSQVEEKSYMDILNETRSKSVEKIQNEGKNIQVIKLYRDRKPAYEFNFITGKMLAYLELCQPELAFLKKTVINTGTEKHRVYINVFQEVLGFFYKGTNLHNMIQNYLRMYLQNNEKIRISTIEMICRIQIKVQSINYPERSGLLNDMKSVLEEGKKLRTALLKNKKNNKIPGMTYQLLNALKTGNKEEFKDMIIRIHISSGLLIPHALTKGLETDKLFKEAGYQFIIGLQSEVVADRNTKNEQKEETK